MSKKLLKSTGIVSIMTFISRISGLVRDVVMANVLGASGVADAFFVAFRIPNFLRRIFAEGAFSQAFVPVFSELTERNTAEAREFVNASTGVLALVTLGLCALGVVFAPALISLYAPGYQSQPEQFAQTVDALRFMFPYLFCISLVALSAGVLNTVNRFAIPAVTPVLLNLCLILALWLLVPVLDNAARALALGVLAAGIVQVVFQLPSLHREGYLPRPKINFKNESVKRVYRLMLPAAFSVSVAQINLLVNTALASTLITGSISWLYYSDRLMEFPVGVFGIALATVVLPNLSKENASGDPQKFSAMLDWALRWVVVISLPASFALYFLATPLIATIYQYNAFTVNDVVQSAAALQAFAIGVCGFIFVKVLAPGFFARQDTKTPMKIAVISVIVNIIAALILVNVLNHIGLALAISIAAWVNAILLFGVLWYSGVYQPEPGWLLFMLRVSIAVAAMSATLLALNVAPQTWYEMAIAERLGRVTILVIAGASAYFASLFILGLRPRQFLLDQ